MSMTHMFETERLPVSEPVGPNAPVAEPLAAEPRTLEQPERAVVGGDFATVTVKGVVIGGPPKVKRSTERGGFWQTIGSFFTGLFSGSPSQRDLVQYLDGLTKRNDIEGDVDSDNKARMVVSRWKSATAGFNLTGRHKALLILEMLSGSTTDDDENAILDLLTRAENGDLRLIFAAVPVKDLLSDFHGGEEKRLRAWLDARFDGGIDAVRSDDIQPRGGLPANAPLFPYDWAHFRVKFDGGYLPQEIIEELARHPLAERERAARDLAVERTTLQAKVLELADRMDSAPDTTTRDALDFERMAHLLTRMRMDVVMEEGFKDVVLTETPAELRGKATVLTPAQKTAARAALKPPVAAAGGAATPFTDTLPGEALTYEEKLRTATPGLIDRYWDRLAKDRQPSDHSDPTKMHTLTEMEGLAKVSKDETDDVFDGLLRQEQAPGDEGRPAGPAGQPARPVAGPAEVLHGSVHEVLGQAGNRQSASSSTSSSPTRSSCRR